MKSRKMTFLGAFILFVAAIADMKYKGLFYRLLPKRIQTELSRIF